MVLEALHHPWMDMKLSALHGVDHCHTEGDKELVRQVKAAATVAEHHDADARARCASRSHKRFVGARDTGALHGVGALARVWGALPLPRRSLLLVVVDGWGPAYRLPLWLLSVTPIVHVRRLNAPSGGPRSHTCTPCPA